MFFGAAADLLALVHLAFICFATAGGLLVLKWRRIVFPHLAAALWGALVEFQGWPCPLTDWENQLRQRGGEAGYAGDFTERYITPIIYPPGLDRQTQIILGVLLAAVNVAVYGWIIIRSRRTKPKLER